MTTAVIITFIISLITISNPIGGIATFISHTTDKTLAEKRQIALTCSFAVLIILIVVTWIGEPLLNIFGISTPSFQAAGGLVMLLLGLSMLNAQTSRIKLTHTEDESAKEKESIAVVPLAMPILAGPGAISTIIIFVDRYNTVPDKLIVSTICIGIASFIAVTLYFAPTLEKILGPTGLRITTRLMGIILIAIAFGVLAEGLMGLLPGLKG